MRSVPKKPKMSRLNPTHLRIAICLLGEEDPEDFKPRRSQKEVSSILKLPPTTVHKYTHDLLDAGYIRLKCNDNRCKLYSRGKSYSVLESMIVPEVREYVISMVSMAKGEQTGNSLDVVRPINTALACTIHPAYVGLMFEVEEEGNLKALIYSVKGKNVEVPFLPESSFIGSENEDIKGSNSIRGIVTVLYNRDNYRYSIRYQRARNVRLLFVTPEDLIFFPQKDAGDRQKEEAAYINACFPLLASMEKRGGWKFAKDERGVYLLHKGKREIHTHYVAIGEVAEEILRRTGQFMSESGEVFSDRSRGALELETTNPKFIQSLDSLPEMAEDIKTLKESGLVRQDEFDSVMRTLISNDIRNAEALKAFQESSEKEHVALRRQIKNVTEKTGELYKGLDMMFDVASRLSDGMAKILDIAVEQQKFDLGVLKKITEPTYVVKDNDDRQGYA